MKGKRIEMYMLGARQIKTHKQTNNTADGRAYAWSELGNKRTKQQRLISTPLFLCPFHILSLWLFPFFFPSSLRCRVRVQPGDKEIETGSSLPLCQTIRLYTAVISPLSVSQHRFPVMSSSTWVCVCVCLCVCRDVLCLNQWNLSLLGCNTSWDSQQSHTDANTHQHTRTILCLSNPAPG